MGLARPPLSKPSSGRNSSSSLFVALGERPPCLYVSSKTLFFLVYYHYSLADSSSASSVKAHECRPIDETHRYKKMQEIVCIFSCDEDLTCAFERASLLPL